MEALWGYFLIQWRKNVHKSELFVESPTTFALGLFFGSTLFISVLLKKLLLTKNTFSCDGAQFLDETFPCISRRQNYRTLVEKSSQSDNLYAIESSIFKIFVFNVRMFDLPLQTRVSNFSAVPFLFCPFSLVFSLFIHLIGGVFIFSSCLFYVEKKPSNTCPNQPLQN